MAHRTLDIALVAAVSDNGVIGRGNDLPWRLPDDMKFFMQLTRGGTVIMGRRTFESMNGKPLANRRNIVVTRQNGWRAEGVESADSLTEAVTLARQEGGKPNFRGVFVIGGAELYRAALDEGLATVMYLTRVHAQVEGDTYFPTVDWARWRLVEQREHPADERHAYTLSFLIYRKT